MSFISAIRDYIDLLNNVYELNLNSINLPEIISHTFIYFFNSIKFVFFYFITFQWIRDFCYLPVIIPHLSVNIFTENYFLQNPNSLKENFFLEPPFFNFFSFLETPFYNNNKFLIGFLNSFFLSLPISCSYIISLRRFLIQGIFAGISSALGTIIGQICFLIFVLFGFRFFLIPWFSFEPLNYILGIGLVLSVVYNMAHEKRIKPINSSEKNILLNIFFINFVLSWTEQSSIFQYLGNITFDAQPTLLEIFSSTNEFEYFLLHGSYIFGIFLGSLFFTTFFGFLFLKLNNFLIKILNFSYYKWTQYLNYCFLTLIITFSLSSIPYYGIDYLFTNPLGFSSRDQLFENTIFSQTNINDKSRVLGAASGFKSLDTDVIPFNRAKYLQNDAVQTFEELNFQGEYAWTSRVDRRALYQQQEKAKELISNLLKKTKKETDNNFEKKEKNENINELRKIQKKVKTEDTQDKTKLNSLSSNNVPKESLFLKNTTLKERFDSDYKLEDGKTAESFLFLTDESFAKEFIEEEPKSQLEKKIKQKYYSNNLYKFLLNTEIDFFMNRQPQSYKLSGKNEKQLFDKRLILANYYDSLRVYNELPSSKDFQQLFYGSKSYADRVFNQQFKGTLKIVRRLFSITLNSELNLNQKIILKFDQPLYKNKTDSLILHEELQKENIKNVPFLELTNPIPFYVGWDEQLRKLVITNRLLPRYLAGFEIKLPNLIHQENNEYWYLNNLMNSSKKIEFTAWPIPKKILESPKNKSLISYTVLFESITDPSNKPLENYFRIEENSSWNYTTLPANIKKINNLGNVLPPSRGGLVWPGESTLKFGIKELLKK